MKLEAWKKGCVKGQMWGGKIMMHLKPHTLIFFLLFLRIFQKEKNSPSSLFIHFHTISSVFFIPSLIYTDPGFHVLLFLLNKNNVFKNLMTMNYFSWNLLKNIFLNFILRISMLDREFWANRFFSFLTLMMLFKTPDFHCVWQEASSHSYYV